METRNPQETQRLKAIALDLRRRMVDALTRASTSYPGDSLSAVEILTALYFHELRANARDPRWSERDRLVLGNRRLAPALYAVLEKAEFIEDVDLGSFGDLESPLESHPRRSLPGVEASIGRPGHALSLANGMALAARMDGKTHRCYALLGEEDLQVGSTWEAVLTAAHHGLGGVCAVVNANGFLADGATASILSLEPLEQKWRSFGWHCLVVNGHHLDDLLRALAVARNLQNRPSCVIARTVWGRGLSWLEGDAVRHARPLGDEDRERALQSLDLIHC